MGEKVDTKVLSRKADTAFDDICTPTQKPDFIKALGTDTFDSELNSLHQENLVEVRSKLSFRSEFRVATIREWLGGHAKVAEGHS